jgi:hypothetical protein
LLKFNEIDYPQKLDDTILNILNELHNDDDDDDDDNDDDVENENLSVEEDDCDSILNNSLLHASESSFCFDLIKILNY